MHSSHLSTFKRDMALSQTNMDVANNTFTLEFQSCFLDTLHDCDMFGLREPPGLLISA
jgi:hypothetical protein